MPHPHARSSAVTPDPRARTIREARFTGSPDGAGSGAARHLGSGCPDEASRGRFGDDDEGARRSGATLFDSDTSSGHR